MEHETVQEGGSIGQFFVKKVRNCPRGPLFWTIFFKKSTELSSKIALLDNFPSKSPKLSNRTAIMDKIRRQSAKTVQ